MGSGVGLGSLNLIPRQPEKEAREVGASPVLSTWPVTRMQFCPLTGERACTAGQVERSTARLTLGSRWHLCSLMGQVALVLTDGLIVWSFVQDLARQYRIP